ncbi:uncharacterized protein [Salvelinus alpinus]|uniref:uncharacterized protein n=1 Tax=Salvelinus alpinus TaxID=8036 RepID=UPI0039FDCAB8
MHSDSNDNDAGAATAGPSDVMYAQIQLKELDKKKKKMTSDPKENPVYSEVKTGKTTAATGPVDVTYAEIDLKQKAKAKKKKETSTPPEADSVYSQLKPVTAPDVGVPLIINKRVGDSVELLAGIENGHFKSLDWKELTLQDSGDFLLTGEGVKGQIGSKTITLKVHEPISKVAIQIDIKLLANRSCTVRLLCNMSCYPNLTYTWERDNEIFGDAQQIHFSLSPAERNISVKCNASNLVSWKTASATVKCSNDTTTPEYVTGLVWYTIYIGVSVGGAVVLILTVAVAVCYCRGRSNTEDLTDNTIYADVMDNTRSIDVSMHCHYYVSECVKLYVLYCNGLYFDSRQDQTVR